MREMGARWKKARGESAGSLFDGRKPHKKRYRNAHSCFFGWTVSDSADEP
jgi:hypothetical protein